MTIFCKRVDYKDPTQAADLIQLLNEYAKDPMGGNKPLAESTQKNLAKALSERNDAFSIIAYDNDTPIGLINCFEGFSTFKCKPLMNIHDLCVSEKSRGKGVGRLLLQAAEELALERKCCKLTLEVLEGNRIAIQAYKNFGFEGYELDPKMGKATFWEKSIT